MGYSEGVKWYRLWDRSVKVFRMITSRNMTFNECDMPCIIDKHQETDAMREKWEMARLQVELRPPSEHINDVQAEIEEVSDSGIEE